MAGRRLVAPGGLGAGERSRMFYLLIFLCHFFVLIYKNLPEVHSTC